MIILICAIFDRTQSLIVQELVDTEAGYIRSLQYVVDNYIPEMSRVSLPEPLRGKKNVVFANLEKIYEFHSECFLRLLQQCMNNPFQLGACFLQHVRSLPSLHTFTLCVWYTCVNQCGVEGDTSRTSPLQGHLTVLKVTVCRTAGHYGEEYDD